MVLGERLRLAFKNAGLPLSQVATHIGISQQSLYTMLKKDSFELDYLRKSSDLLGIPISSLLDDSVENLSKTKAVQTGDFNQAGNSNSQKIKVSKAPAQELATELAACQRELEVTRALVASKDELITLLRGTYNRPN